MNEKTRRSIQEIEEVIHKRTSVSSTRFRQKNKNESRCMRLCNGRGILEIKGEVYKRTSVSSTRFRQKKENRS